MTPNAPYDPHTFSTMVNKIKVYCSKVIPLVFDNTLSYYESLCAFCAKLNELCDAVTSQSLAITEFTHMVELEIDKFKTYVDEKFDGYDAAISNLQLHMNAIEQKEEVDRANIEALQTLTATHTGQITVINSTLTYIQNQLNAINTALNDKVNKTDVVNIVQENNLNPVTSNAVYEALQQGGGGGTIPDATTTSKGKVQVGDNINVESGVISVPEATTTTNGVVKLSDNFAINSNGQATVKRGRNVNVDSNGGLTIPFASSITAGVVKVPDVNSDIDVDTNGNLTIHKATGSTYGLVKLGNNIYLDNGAIYVPAGESGTENVAMKGVVSTGENILNSNGHISVRNATTVNKGVVTADAQTSGLALNDGALSVNKGDTLLVNAQTGKLDVKDATTTTKGAVQVGSNISVTDGVISVRTGDKTSARKGVVTVDTLSASGLNLIDGVLSVKVDNDTIKIDSTTDALYIPTASTSQLGVIAPALNSALTVDQNGMANVRTATDTLTGVFKVVSNVGSTYTDAVPTSSAVWENCAHRSVENYAVRADVPDTDGNCQLYKIDAQGIRTDLYPTVQGGGTTPTIPDATTSTKGKVQVGDNIEVTSGVISVPDATTTTKGVIKYGNNFSINSNGQLAISTGANVSTDANGALTVPTASSAVKGVVSIGNNLIITNGELSVPLAGASASIAGVVAIDSTNTPLYTDHNDNEILKIKKASASDFGVVKAGSNITNLNGVISVPYADVNSYGVVSKTNTISSGNTDVPTSDAVYQALQGGTLQKYNLAQIVTNSSNRSCTCSYKDNATTGYTPITSNFGTTKSFMTLAFTSPGLTGKNTFVFQFKVAPFGDNPTNDELKILNKFNNSNAPYITYLKITSNNSTENAILSPLYISHTTDASNIYFYITITPNATYNSTTSIELSFNGEVIA